MENRPNFFLFFKMANTPHKGKTRHLAWSILFLFKVQCFYRDENGIAPYDKYYIRGKRNALWFGNILEERWLCFWYTSSFNWKSSLCENGYPNFFFEFPYLLLIALYTNSTYMIWLKRYSVVFKKRLLLRCLHHFNRFKLTTWTICAFRVLNPLQWSLAKHVV